MLYDCVVSVDDIVWARRFARVEMKMISINKRLIIGFRIGEYSVNYQFTASG